SQRLLDAAALPLHDADTAFTACGGGHIDLSVAIVRIAPASAFEQAVRSSSIPNTDAGARTCLAGNDRTGGIVAVRVNCPRPTRVASTEESLNEVRTHRHNGIGPREASIIVACRGQRGSLVTLLHGAGRQYDEQAKGCNHC